MNVLRRKPALEKKDLIRLNDNKNILGNKNEIWKVTENFYRKLYKQKQEKSKPEEEFTGALIEMKNFKAQGE